MIPDCAILVARILGGYDIDWARLIAEQIDKATVKWSISIPFSCLVY